MPTGNNAEPTANADRRLRADAKRVSRPKRGTNFELPNGQLIDGYFVLSASTTDDTPTAMTVFESDESSLVLKNFESWLIEARVIGVRTDGAQSTEGAGTAQSGTTNTIELAAVTNQADDFYNGKLITIMDGTGKGQTRAISDYVGATDVATVDEDWDTIPDATSVYSIKEGIGGTLVRVITGGIRRRSGAASTDLAGAMVDVLDANSGLAGAVSVTADVADGSMVITVTGIAATDIEWDAEVSVTRLPYQTADSVTANA
jgi:hypothetical protein